MIDVLQSMISRPEHLDVSCPTIAGRVLRPGHIHIRFNWTVYPLGNRPNNFKSLSRLVHVGMFGDVYLPNFEDTLTMLDLDIKHLHSMVPKYYVSIIFYPLLSHGFWGCLIFLIWRGDKKIIHAASASLCPSCLTPQEMWSIFVHAILCRPTGASSATRSIPESKTPEIPICLFVRQWWTTFAVEDREKGALWDKLLCRISI